jgi:hypothetical protein
MRGPVPPDELVRLVIEVDLVIRPERSRLAPLTREQRKARRELAKEVAEMRAMGQVVESKRLVTP